MRFPPEPGVIIGTIMLQGVLLASHAWNMSYVDFGREFSKWSIILLMILLVELGLLALSFCDDFRAEKQKTNHKNACKEILEMCRFPYN